MTGTEGTGRDPASVVPYTHLVSIRGKGEGRLQEHGLVFIEIKDLVFLIYYRT